MSRRHDIQDNTGVVERHATRGVIQAVGTGNPSNGQPNYAPGCTYQRLDATALGTFLWVNTGTATSSTWTNIL